MRKDHSTRDICIARKRTRLSENCRPREPQFGKLSGKLVIPESLSAMFCAASDWMYSERGLVRWIAGCRGSTADGRKVHETPWRSGARCWRRAFLGKAVSSRNGHNVGVLLRRQSRVDLLGHHRRGSSHA